MDEIQVNINTRKAVSIAALADRWNISKETLYRKTRDGSCPVPHFKIGGSVRFLVSDVEAYERGEAA